MSIKIVSKYFVSTFVKKILFTSSSFPRYSDKAYKFVEKCFFHILSMAVFFNLFQGAEPMKRFGGTYTLKTVKFGAFSGNTINN